MASSGCQEEVPEEVSTCERLEPVPISPGGLESRYIVDSIKLPIEAIDIHNHAENLDCDSRERTDGSLNSALSIIAFQGQYDFGEEIQSMLEAGQMLHLLDVTATSLENAEGVGVHLSHGLDLDDDPKDNFSGQEPFGINEDVSSGVTTGSITDGFLSTNLGVLPLAVTFPGLEEPFIIHLAAARMKATITDSKIDGKIAGVLTQEEVSNSLIPALVEGFARIIKRDCEELSGNDGCIPDSFGEVLIKYFDDDKSGNISAEEIQGNDLTRALLAPHVDMFDEEGHYAPRTDGVKDSVSCVFLFTAKKTVR